MDLSNLKPAEGATKARKRIGRGQGSGYGGHTATKGNKGQKSRSGGGVPVWFEGGQMPLQRRIPKFGFKNRFRTEYSAVNVARLAELASSGKIDSSQEITPEVLRGVGLLGKNDLVKILGGGEIDTALKVSANGFSASAVKKIEAAGGTTTVL
ncbi:MAG: 50S ribosomal protein L15 [Bacteroidetes Order II. Incertae sedis bacterium]|jgi:large subunit ribosomal protein L15|nr:50S ribosomal protein L15 [Bacteroidetes Order II. bacterium]MDG1755362.1 50S ribosomal protein L15 [Rhodothermales bacterium]HAY37285.1 50S ribosomal protein L15 [Bacteroidota bacterium]MBT4603792.1 50S ribosomal protein L15 [Bacteroidetes Order II. bacterium]MBT5249308.1 50S ribosomal protein L15 [Bacteroidetes Order II. bacterium]